MATTEISDEKIIEIIHALNDYAIDYDEDNYGLTLHGEHHGKLVNIVKECLKWNQHLKTKN